MFFVHGNSSILPALFMGIRIIISIWFAIYITKLISKPRYKGTPQPKDEVSIDIINRIYQDGHLTEKEFIQLKKDLEESSS